MKTILITGAGSPSIFGTVNALSFAPFRYKIIGVDCDPNAVGKTVVDYFEVIPKPDSKEFVPKLTRIVQKYKVDVIIPQVTAELFILSNIKNHFKKTFECKILVNDMKTINLVNNKANLLDYIHQYDHVMVPGFKMVNNTVDLVDACLNLGYPYKKVVVKLPISCGGRGFRILDENHDYADDFLNNKPNSAIQTLQDFSKGFIGKPFPNLLAMEYLPGTEYTVDCLANKGKPIIIFPRTRDKVINGISFITTGVNHPQIIDYCTWLIQTFKLDSVFGFQFKNDRNGNPKLIECNPRTHGSMGLSTYSMANVILGAVTQALWTTGLNCCPPLHQRKIVFGRKMNRYWGGIIDEVVKF